jgi:dTMP kinase
MSNTPLLIAIEGIDGCGKGTQTELLREKLGAYSLHFPNYETDTGKLILRMLKGEAALGTKRSFGLQREDAATALALQALMLANRFEIIPEIIDKLNGDDLRDIPAQTIIFDRYHISGLVYGAYDGLDKQWLANIHSELPKPDLAVLIDISSEASFERRPVRDNAYEAKRERIDYVADAYTKLWADPPEDVSWQGYSTQWIRINGERSIEEVHADIMHHVKMVQSEVADLHAWLP